MANTTNQLQQVIDEMQNQLVSICFQIENEQAACTQYANDMERCAKAIANDIRNGFIASPGHLDTYVEGIKATQARIAALHHEKQVIKLFLSRTTA